MKRLIGAACCCVLLSTSTVEAGHGHCHGHSGWNFSFVYGGGYYPRPYYAPYYYYPPPVVYAPPVYAAPVVVPLAQATAPAAAATVSAPTPTMSAQASGVQTNSVPTARPIRGVTLQNPATTGGNVSFVIDSRSNYDLKSGDELPLTQKNAYYIEFDRGTGSGTMKRTLTEGTYEFVVTPQGWDLQQTGTGDGGPDFTPTVQRNTLPTVR